MFTQLASIWHSYQPILFLLLQRMVIIAMNNVLSKKNILAFKNAKEMMMMIVYFKVTKSHSFFTLEFDTYY